MIQLFFETPLSSSHVLSQSCCFTQRSPVLRVKYGSCHLLRMPRCFQLGSTLLGTELRSLNLPSKARRFKLRWTEKRLSRLSC